MVVRTWTLPWAWARAMVRPPPGFLAVCTLMINVYRNLGHGVAFIGAWTQDAFTLPAVLYVDDSDLFNWNAFG